MTKAIAKAKAKQYWVAIVYYPTDAWQGGAGFYINGPFASMKEGKAWRVQALRANKSACIRITPIDTDI